MRVQVEVGDLWTETGGLLRVHLIASGGEVRRHVEQVGQISMEMPAKSQVTGEEANEVILKIQDGRRGFARGFTHHLR